MSKTLAADGWVGTGSRGLAMNGQRQALAGITGCGACAAAAAAAAAAPGGSAPRRWSPGSSGMLGMLSQGLATQTAGLAAD